MIENKVKNFYEIMNVRDINIHDKNKKTIPILIDSMKKDIELIRFSFLIINIDQEAFDWIKFLRKKSIPFITIGQLNIIYQPNYQKKIFDTAKSINRLANKFDDNYISLGSNDIFLPDYLFKENKNKGDVYRVDYELFRNAIEFKLDIIDVKTFKNGCLDYTNKIYYSSIETESFKNWEISMIGEIKQKHNKLREQMNDKYFEHFLRYKGGG